MTKSAARVMLKVNARQMNKVWDLSNDEYAKIIQSARQELTRERDRIAHEKSTRSLFRRVFGTIEK